MAELERATDSQYVLAALDAYAQPVEEHAFQQLMSMFKDRCADLGFEFASRRNQPYSEHLSRALDALKGFLLVHENWERNNGRYVYHIRITPEGKEFLDRSLRHVKDRRQIEVCKKLATGFKKAKS